MVWEPELGEISRITLWQSLRCVRLVLWDERSNKLVSFRDAAKAAGSSGCDINLQIQP